MSQIHVPLTSSGPIPPIIPTEFDTQNGNAVPAANILIIDAFDSTEDNNNGIVTKGGVAAGDPPGTGATNEVSVYLTNRITGTATTNDGTTPQTLASFPLGATPGTYLMETKVVVFNVTDGLSATFSSSAGMVTNGVTATITTVGNFFQDEIPPMDAVDIAISVTDTPNTFTIEVIGIAGKIIHYRTLTNYLFVS